MRTKNQISQSASVSKKGSNTNINQNKIIIEMPKQPQRRQYAPRKKSIAEAEQELKNLENQDAGYSMGNPINVSVVQPPTINPSVYGYSHLPIERPTEVIPSPPEYFTEEPITAPVTEAPTRRKGGRPLGSKNRPRQSGIIAEPVSAGYAKAEGYYTDVGGYPYTENPLAFEKIYGQGFNQPGYRSDFEERRIEQAKQDLLDSGGGKAGSEYIQTPNDLLLAKLKAKREGSISKTPKLIYSSGSDIEIPTRFYKPVIKKKSTKAKKLIIEKDIIPPATSPAEIEIKSPAEIPFVKQAGEIPTKAQKLAIKKALRGKD
jgi:hypothetical protein